jgi:hypothetical protein
MEVVKWLLEFSGDSRNDEMAIGGQWALGKMAL